VRNAGKHRHTLIEEAAADIIRSTLEMTHWNKAKAAELLEISRSRLYRKVKAYGLVPNLFPAPAQVHDALVVTGRSEGLRQEVRASASTRRANVAIT
jgi:hypothetical protein